MNAILSGHHHVCPWWLAYTFDNVLRRMVHPAEKLLGPYVKPGMTALDLGCGHGHFTLGMARLAGPGGRVIPVDIQRKCLDITRRRARRAGMANRVTPHLCPDDGIGPAAPPESVDFALSCNCLHEIPDPEPVVTELRDLLAPNGQFLLMEPKFHLSGDAMNAEVELVRRAGFSESGRPSISGQMSVLFTKALPA